MAAAPVDSDLETFTDDLRERLRSVFASRPWVVASEVIQGATFMASALRGAGAPDVFAVGAVAGIGPVPDDYPTVVIGLDGVTSMLDSIRAADVMLHDPPPSVTDAIDAWDPGSRARSIVDFTMSGGVLCGRESYGARGLEWVALEDKLVAREIWRQAGIATAPDAVVELNDADACRIAHDTLASDLGTVWAGDNREGWHGGADGTRWVHGATAVDDAIAAMSKRHDVVRVMPFVEGIPCSVHGMVLAEKTIAFRPMELFIYREMAQHRIVYGKASGHWDPSPADRAVMRSAAVAVGEELRRRADFRGIFTLDGIMSADGFVPTEVNPRFGGALPGLIGAPNGVINLMFVNLCAVEGDLDDLDADRLEEWVLSDLDGRRRGIGMLETENAPEADRQMFVGAGLGGELEMVDSEEDALCNVMWGEKAPHGLIRMVGLDGIEPGGSKAGFFLHVAKLADTHWNIGIPDLVAASDMRRP